MTMHMKYNVLNDNIQPSQIHMLETSSSGILGLWVTHSSGFYEIVFGTSLPRGKINVTEKNK